VEVLALLAQGLSNAALGRRLGVTELTVKSHLKRIGAKLGCTDRAGMVGIAYRTGVLRVPDAPAAARPSPAEALIAELNAELLAMARMLIANQPLGMARVAALRAVRLADSRGEGGRP